MKLILIIIKLNIEITNYIIWFPVILLTTNNVIKGIVNTIKENITNALIDC